MVEKENSADELAKHQGTPATKKKAAEFAARAHHIDELIKHNEPGFLEKSLAEGYKGSSVRTHGTDGSGRTVTKWEKASLDHVQRTLYDSTTTKVDAAIRAKKEDAHVIGLEHFVTEALESLRDHDDAKQHLQSYKKLKEVGHFKGKKGQQKKLDLLKVMAGEVLYLDEKQINAYTQLISRGDIDKYRQATGKLTDTLGKNMIEGHLKYVQGKVFDKHEGIGQFKSAVYNRLDPENRAKDADTYQNMDANELLQIFYTQEAGKEQNAQLKKAGKIRGK